MNYKFIIAAIALCMLMLVTSCNSNEKEQPIKPKFNFAAADSAEIADITTQDSEPPLPFLISGEIPKGGVLANVLKENGLNGNDIYSAVNTLNSIFDLRKVQPGDKFEVMTDSTGFIYEMFFYRNPVKKYQVYRDSTGSMQSMIVEEELELEVCQISGILTSSLYKTVLDAGEQPALAMDFTQIYQWDIDFFIDPRKGDKITILFEKYSLNGKHVRYGNILAASYKSKRNEDIAYRYTDKKGISKYYDETGKCFQKAFLKSPLNYTRITSKFGPRIHPITKKRSIHNGVDYAAPYGTPIEAAADGVVEKASWNPGHTGNTVIIKHPNGYKTLYGHLSKYGKYKKGARVEQHDIIGYVGSTGRSTGNHLHYTIYHHGKPIDPLKLKNVSGPPVPNAEMKEFKNHVAVLKEQLLANRDDGAIQPPPSGLAADTTSSEFSTALPEEESEADQDIYIPEGKNGTARKSNIWMILVFIQFAIIIGLVFVLYFVSRK